MEYMAPIALSCSEEYVDVLACTHVPMDAKK